MQEDRWGTSHDLWDRARGSLAGGVSTGLRASMKPHPLYFDRALGARMWDVDGNELLDYVLGWGAIILGHCDPNVTQAVQAQAARGELFGAQHHLEYEVAERVLSHFGFFDRILYSNTGSEAVQAALRLARAFTHREKIVKFIGHYHGWPDSVLISYRSPPHSREPYPNTGGQSAAALASVFVAPWNDRSAVEDLFEAHGNDIAAVIAEPVLCNSGVIAPEPGFLTYLREITSQHGSLLVFDEVITGYRVGLSGATGRFGVVPDLVTLGKAIANGYPLSVVAGRGEIVDQVVTGGVVHAGTFNGNPIALAAAFATLKVLEQSGVYGAIEANTALLADGLRELLAERGVAAVVNQIGGVAQILPQVKEPVREYDDFVLADWAWYDALSVELLARGIFVMPGGRLYTSLAHTEQDIEETLRAFGAAVDATLAQTSTSSAV